MQKLYSIASATLMLSAIFLILSCDEPQLSSSISGKILDQKTIEVPKEPKGFLTEHKVRKGMTTFATLYEAGIPSSEIAKLVKASSEVFDLSLVRVGNVFRVKWLSDAKKNLLAVSYLLSRTKKISISKVDDGGYRAESIEIPVDVELVGFSGKVKSSLWETANASGLHPGVIGDFAEVFAWQVDFSREVRKGDTWRLLVEKRFINGEFLEWGSVKAAEYCRGEFCFEAVRYVTEDGKIGFYRPDGGSLEALFLRSPVRFSRISSKFNRRRLHPVLKKRRPHLGVDYAAKRGTPVRSVGDGIIVGKGVSRTAGKYLKIRHNAVYSTAYKHLHFFAKGVKKGTRVKQGQRIGGVGSTGLATGPHLHFEFYRYGKYVDPLGIKFPTASSVPKKELAIFKILASQRLGSLPTVEDQGEELKGITEILLDPHARFVF